jgi:hypothetical protein
MKVLLIAMVLEIVRVLMTVLMVVVVMTVVAVVLMRVVVVLRVVLAVCTKLAAALLMESKGDGWSDSWGGEGRTPVSFELQVGSNFVNVLSMEGLYKSMITCWMLC